jgi:hypothetical protein
MDVFVASLVYDLAVNKFLGFATVSYGRPSVEHLSLPAVDAMLDAWRKHKR